MINFKMSLLRLHIWIRASKSVYTLRKLPKNRTLVQSLAASRSTWARFYRSRPLAVHFKRVRYELANSLWKVTKADRRQAMAALMKCRYSGY